MIGAFPLPRCDSVGSLPVRAKLSLGGVSGGAHYLPQDEVSNLEVSVFDLGVVMLGHDVLLLCKSLFSCYQDFV